MSRVKPSQTISANSVMNALSEAYPQLTYGAVPLVDQLEAVESYLNAHFESQQSTRRASFPSPESGVPLPSAANPHPVSPTRRRAFFWKSDD